MKEKLFFCIVASLFCTMNVNASTFEISKEKKTPWMVLCQIWADCGKDTTVLNLFTTLERDDLEIIYPKLKKGLKIKKDVSTEDINFVGDLLTSMLEVKYGKKSNEKNDFYAIQYSIDTENFKDYQRKYPNSQFLKEANARQDCVEDFYLLVRALNENTREAYKTFMNSCDKHEICQYEGLENVSLINMWRSMEVEEWYSLADRSTGKDPSIYMDFYFFIENYGERALFYEAAKDSMELNMDRYDWQQANKIGTSAAYKKYLSKYDEDNPGIYTWKASKLIEELDLWEKAELTQAYEDYANYYSSYPDGIYSERAVSKIKEIEQSAWEVATKTNTLKGYEDFVANYPHGFYASEAYNKMSDLRWAPYAKDAPTLGDFFDYTYYSHPNYSLVFVGNSDTSKTITVSFKGATGFSKTIAPGKFEWVRVRNGKYRILVQASDTQSWWGNASFENRVYYQWWYTYTEFLGSTTNHISPLAEQKFTNEVKTKGDKEYSDWLNYILGIK